jgi:hypothetical protein
MMQVGAVLGPDLVCIVAVLTLLIIRNGARKASVVKDGGSRK